MDGILGGWTGWMDQGQPAGEVPRRPDLAMDQEHFFSRVSLVSQAMRMHSGLSVEYRIFGSSHFC